MAGFLVEFRLHGYAKDYAKELIYSVARKHRVKGVTRKRVVPHISLYGPGETKDIRKVVSAVERVGRKHTLVPFRIKGFGFFDKVPKVIYLDISPSEELEELISLSDRIYVIYEGEIMGEVKDAEVETIGIMMTGVPLQHIKDGEVLGD